MSVDAYRSKFFQTVQEIWEDSVIHTYDVGEEGQEFVPHEPSYIPEGYEEVSRYASGNFISIEYANLDDKYIYWDQRTVGQNDWQITSYNYTEQYIEKINGKILVVSIYDDGSTQVYWESNKYIYFITSNDLELEEIERIFNSSY